MEPRLGNRHRKKPFRLKRWQWILLVVFLLLGSGFAYAYYRINSALDHMTSNSEPKTDDESKVPPVTEPYSEDPFAVILLGKDSREGLGLLNTDVMIVGIVNPKEKKVQLLSIPRDTRVMIPNNGYSKVNAAYAYGESIRKKQERNQEPITMTGIRMVKQTLEGFLGIPVKHYVTVDFEGFRKVIDELGGIEVDVERRLVYHDPTDGTNIDLQPGLQPLDGQKALDYVRHRHDDRGSKYFSSDFERNARERLVISLVADKMKSFSGITHVFNILDIAGNHITTDLSKDQIIGLFNTFAPVGSTAIESIETKPYWDGSSYTMFSKEEMTKLRQTLWTAMGMTEEEGLALIDPANDRAPKKVVTKPAPPKPKQTEPKRETPPPDAKNQDGTKPDEPAAPPQNENPPADGGPQDGTTPPDEGNGTPDQGNPDQPAPPDETPPPADQNPPADGNPGDGGTLPPGNTAAP